MVGEGVPVLSKNELIFIIVLATSCFVSAYVGYQIAIYTGFDIVKISSDLQRINDKISEISKTIGLKTTTINGTELTITQQVEILNNNLNKLSEIIRENNKLNQEQRDKLYKELQDLKKKLSEINNSVVVLKEVKYIYLPGVYAP